MGQSPSSVGPSFADVGQTWSSMDTPAQLFAERHFQDAPRDLFAPNCLVPPRLIWSSSVDRIAAAMRLTQATGSPQGIRPLQHKRLLHAVVSPQAVRSPQAKASRQGIAHGIATGRGLAAGPQPMGLPQERAWWQTVGSPHAACAPQRLGPPQANTPTHSQPGKQPGSQAAGQPRRMAC